MFFFFSIGLGIGVGETKAVFTTFGVRRKLASPPFPCENNINKKNMIGWREEKKEINKNLQS
jgi:hypothetical protein